MSLLESINSPDDLADLTSEEMDRLAGEIRQFLVPKVAATGGHLGPNLGVVELTLALHRVFDSPRSDHLRHRPPGLRAQDAHRSLPRTSTRCARRAGCRATRRAPRASTTGSSPATRRRAVLRRRAGQGLRAERAPQPARRRRRRRRRAHRRHVLGGAEQHRRRQSAGGDRRQRQRPQLRARPSAGSPTTWPALRLQPGYEQLLERGPQGARAACRSSASSATSACTASRRASRTRSRPQVMFTDLGLKYVGPIDGHDEHAVESRAAPRPRLQRPGDRARRDPQGHGLRARRERRGRPDARHRRHRPADRPGHRRVRTRLDVGVLRSADQAGWAPATTSSRSPRPCPARPG